MYVLYKYFENKIKLILITMYATDVYTSLFTY